MAAFYPADPTSGPSRWFRTGFMFPIPPNANGLWPPVQSAADVGTFFFSPWHTYLNCFPFKKNRCSGFQGMDPRFRGVPVTVPKNAFPQNAIFTSPSWRWAGRPVRRRPMAHHAKGHMSRSLLSACAHCWCFTVSSSSRPRLCNLQKQIVGGPWHARSFFPL